MLNRSCSENEGEKDNTPWKELHQHVITLDKLKSLRNAAVNTNFRQIFQIIIQKCQDSSKNFYQQPGNEKVTDNSTFSKEEHDFQVKRTQRLIQQEKLKVLTDFLNWKRRTGADFLGQISKTHENIGNLIEKYWNGKLKEMTQILREKVEM